MIAFPPAKINIGLSIQNKRTDGYHNLQSVFYPINWVDCLEIIVQSTNEQQVQFSQTGLCIDVADRDNLCVKAYWLLAHKYPQITSVAIHLHKVIPMGAGLGGGSADAAYVLLLLNKLFFLNISTKELQHYALQLGSDCPFFILSTPAFGEGRGEKLTPLTLSLAAYQLVVVNPGIHISTAQAFNNIVPTLKKDNLFELIQQPVELWKGNLINDFEAAAITQKNEIGQIIEQLYAAGALYAAMTGSGSTLYGIFPRNEKIELPVFPAHYIIKQIEGSLPERHF